MDWNRFNKSVSTKGIRKLKRSSKLKSLWTTIVEFGENTSFHGVKYVVSKDSSLFEKILWLLIVISGVAGSVYMTLVFWDRYTSNPIRTTIQSSHKPTSAIPFPGVTICSAIRMVPRKVDELFKTAKIPNTLTKQKVLDAFPYLLGYTQPLEVNQSIINILETFLAANNMNSMQQLLERLEPTCEEMFYKCKWMARPANCREIFIKAVTKDGSCCTLNFTENLQAFQSPREFYYGYQMGLSVIIESGYGARESNNIVSSLQSVGAKVLIHNIHEYPGMSSIEKLLGNGTESFIRVLGTRLMCSGEVKSLDIDQRDCLFETEQTLEYFPTYKDSNCEIECKMNKMLAACKCIPFTYPATGKRVCNVTDIPCLTTYYPSFYRNPPKLPLSLAFSKQGGILRSMPKCTCLPNCNDIFYSVIMTGVPLLKVPYTATTFYDEMMNDDDRGGRASKMVIHVFFGNHAQVVMLRDRITSTYYLLSSFGGVFSLFLGCSFVSVLEILYFFCIRLFVNYKKNN